MRNPRDLRLHSRASMFFRNFNQYRNSISLIQFALKKFIFWHISKQTFLFLLDKHISLWNFANKSGVKFSDRKIKCLISVKLIEVVPFKTRKKMGNFVFSTYLPDRKAKNKTFTWRKKENQCITSLLYSRQWWSEGKTQNVSKPGTNNDFKLKDLSFMQNSADWKFACTLPIDF